MENKHKSKTAKRDRMRRILCLILAIMMVGGTAVTLVLTENKIKLIG